MLWSLCATVLVFSSCRGPDDFGDESYDDDLDAAESGEVPTQTPSPRNNSQTKHRETELQGTSSRATKPLTKKPAPSSDSDQSKAIGKSKHADNAASTKAGSSGDDSKASSRTPKPGEASTAQIVADLKDPEKAQDAFRRLWQVPTSQIPALLELVEKDEATALEHVRIRLVQKDFVKEGQPFLGTRIHGLGLLERLSEDGQHVEWQAYTRMAYGILPNRKDYFVRIEKFGGLPLGLVIRSGLLTRFQSTKFPQQSDDTGKPGDLVRWWREYYRRAGATLPSP